MYDDGLDLQMLMTILFEKHVVNHMDNQIYLTVDELQAIYHLIT
jgi:hypothetical protein